MKLFLVVFFAMAIGTTTPSYAEEPSVKFPSATSAVVTTAGMETSISIDAATGNLFITDYYATVGQWREYWAIKLNVPSIYEFPTDSIGASSQGLFINMGQAFYDAMLKYEFQWDNTRYKDTRLGTVLSDRDKDDYARLEKSLVTRAFYYYFANSFATFHHGVPASEMQVFAPQVAAEAKWVQQFCAQGSITDDSTITHFEMTVIYDAIEIDQDNRFVKVSDDMYLISRHLTCKPNPEDPTVKALQESAKGKEDESMELAVEPVSLPDVGVPDEPVAAPDLSGMLLMGN